MNDRDPSESTTSPTPYPNQGSAAIPLAMTPAMSGYDAQPESTMKTFKASERKLGILLTTVNLIMWFWALEVIGRSETARSPTPLLAGVALMFAAWLQYRTVLASGTSEKK